MKKLITVFVVTLIVNNIIAATYDCEINGIYFKLDKVSRTAYVTKKEWTYAPKCYTNLVSLTIPSTITYDKKKYSVTSIGDSAFEGCVKLQSVTIPESVKWIGHRAFGGCSGILSIKIPKTVKGIYPGAFDKVNNVEYTGTAEGSPWRAKCVNGYVEGDLVYSDSSKTTLCGCSSSFQGGIVIPNSVSTIGEDAFYFCHNITSIDIPHSVTEIKESAFYLCKSLTSIMIPNSVTTIESFTFDGCSGLTSIFIPNSVIKIEDFAFSGCSNLTSVTIPDSVKTIEDYAFSKCYNLASISIPSSVIEIGDFAFKNCSDNLTIYVSSISKQILQNITYIPHLKIIYDQIPENISTSKSQRPLLHLVENSLHFIESISNNAIDANETCLINFQIQNKGKTPAIGCQLLVHATGSITGIDYPTIKLPTIPVNAIHTIEIPLHANLNTQDGIITFDIRVNEPNGFGIDPITFCVNTHAFDEPLVKIVDYAVSGNGVIQKKQPFNLQLLLQNIKHGKAEDVDVAFSLPAGVSLWEGKDQIHYAALNGGEQKRLEYQLAISGNYASDIVPIHVTVKEKYGKFSENKTINLNINQQLASVTSISLLKQQQEVHREEIAIGVLGSDVDRNIPKTSTINSNTFALIIANENYKYVASVPFARNDGDIFCQYCRNTLGLPEKNIKFLPNATLNDIKTSIGTWLQNLIAVWDDPKVIVYYAGHGIPDESNKSAYLLPVDGNSTDVTTGYKLDELYTALGGMPATHIIVFMDACFSGSKRENGMLASARGIAIKAKAGAPQGNTVVFSAAQGDETAYPNNEQGHGMFTYYLLKKLQDTKGDVTMQELGDYIMTNVRKQSVYLNGKSQTPCVTPASAVANSWQSWKLK